MATKFASCQGCPLYDAPGPVWGEGPDRPRFIYIGQNPGEEEGERGHPFIGPSGGVLNVQLTQAGIRRADVYITNLVKCVTPHNRVPTGFEIQKCACLLQQELAKIQCDVVVLAGQSAMAAHLDGFSTISPDYDPGAYKTHKTARWVMTGKHAPVLTRMGCIEQRDGRKWIATPHPASIMRDPEHKFDAIEHLKKARLASGIMVPKPAILTDPTDGDVRDAVQHVVSVSKMFADDFETYSTLPDDEEDYVGDDTEISMCALAYKDHTAMVLSPQQVRLLEPALRAPDVWHFEHNGPYDGNFMNRYVPRKLWQAPAFDTMHAAHFHRSYAPKALKGKPSSILSRYTWLPYYGRDIQRLDMKLYCGLDGVATFDAAQTLMQVLRGERLWDLFFRLGMPILEELEEWRYIGLNIDLRRALVIQIITQAKIEEANRRIRDIVGDPTFNPASDDQMRDLLYERWMLPVQFNGRGLNKTVTTDYEARKRLRWEIEKRKRLPEAWTQAREFLLLIDYVAGETKKLEYFERISPDGRIHPFFKGHGAESFRLSSSPNVQNVPIHPIEKWQSHGEAVPDPVALALTGIEGDRSVGSIRSVVLPDNPETDWILTCDFDQIQIWIMAVVFNVKWLLEVFRSGDYLYGVVYEKLFKEPFWAPGVARTKQNKLDTVTPERLRRAKAVPLGFLFGRQAEAVAEEYGWSVDEAKVLRTWWFGQCPELEQGMTDTKFRVANDGRIRHAFGQLMWYPSGKMTEAINGFAQSNEALIVIESLVKISRELKAQGYRQKGARLMLSVHDSLSLNVPEPLVVPVYTEIVKPNLERAIPELGGFRFKHSAEVSKRWDWDDDTKKNEPRTFDEWRAWKGL